MRLPAAAKLRPPVVAASPFARSMPRLAPPCPVQATPALTWRGPWRAPSRWVGGRETKVNGKRLAPAPQTIPATLRRHVRCLQGWNDTTACPESDFYGGTYPCEWWAPVSAQHRAPECWLQRRRDCRWPRACWQGLQRAGPSCRCPHVQPHHPLRPAFGLPLPAELRAVRLLQCHHSGASSD